MARNVASLWMVIAVAVVLTRLWLWRGDDAYAAAFLRTSLTTTSDFTTTRAAPATTRTTGPADTTTAAAKVDLSKFTAPPVLVVDGKLNGTIPWKAWSDALPRVSYESLDWRADVGRVPFFMYDDADWDELMNIPFKCVGRTKVCAEFYFLHQLRFHPWRVDDAKEAALIVLPVITSDFINLGRGTKGNVPRLNELFEKVRGLIKKAGNEERTHVVSVTDWVTRDVLGVDKWKDVKDFIVVAEALFYKALKSAPQGMKVFPAGLSIKGPREAFQPDLAPPVDSIDVFRQRKFTFNFLGRADIRMHYFLRTLLLQQFRGVRAPNVLVLKRSPGVPERLYLPPCKLEKDPLESDFEGCSIMTNMLSLQQEDELMRRSKYVLVTRGDDGGSQRIHQALLNGSMPIVIGRATINEGLPFHCVVPWRRIAYVFADQKVLLDKTAATAVIKRIDEETDSEFEERRRLYRQHRPDLVWELSNSRVATNVLLEAAKRLSPDELAKAGVSQLDFGCVAGGADVRFNGFSRLESNVVAEKGITQRYRDDDAARQTSKAIQK